MGLKEKIGNYTKEWREEILRHKKLIAISLMFILIAIIANFYAGSYADRKAAGSAAVSDIILDAIPVVNLSYIFVFGYLLMYVVFFFYPIFFRVRDIHIIFSQFSLLILVRSFFLTLTHLKVPTDSIPVDWMWILDKINFQNDLFFSGHVAIAFLGYLIFRKEKIGIFFLIATPVMALTVLFMHLHYSIDVFAAIFITYGTFKIGGWLFKEVNHYQNG